jgi:hypothetical protein
MYMSANAVALSASVVMRGMTSLRLDPPGEIARVRQDLRDHLMAGTVEGAGEPLDHLRQVAEGAAARGDREAAELRAEYERWRVRFELLAGYC